MCTPCCEILPKAVASHVRHVMFVRERRNGALWVFFRQGLVEEDEICEASANRGVGGLEGFEVGLSDYGVSWSYNNGQMRCLPYVACNEK